MKRIFVALVIAASLAAIVNGILEITKYQKKLDSYQRAPAAIISTDVKEHTYKGAKGSISTRYEPVVHYRFWANDREIEGSTVFPEYKESGKEWAYEVIEKFTEDVQVYVYYDPLNPFNVFLIKQYPFDYYAYYILLALVFLLLEIYFFLNTSKKHLKKPKPPVKLASGQFEILPYMKTSKYLHITLVMFITWVLIGILPFWHIFSRSEPPFEKTPYYFALLLGAISLFIFGFLSYYIILSIYVEDARIYTDTGNFFLGQTLKAEFHQTYKKKISIKTASLVIKAVSFDTGKKGGSPIEYPHLTRRYKISKDRTVDKGEALELVQKLKIPSDKKPTTPPNQKGYPRYQWRFEIKVSFHKLPVYRIKYPIVVEESGSQEN